MSSRGRSIRLQKLKSKSPRSPLSPSLEGGVPKCIYFLKGGYPFLAKYLSVYTHQPTRFFCGSEWHVG
jgi:hypothetical protein